MTYQVVDSAGSRSAAQAFTITVDPVADAPVAATTGNSANGTEDMLVSGKLPAGSDPDGNVGLTYALVQPVAGLTFNGSDGSFSFMPAKDFNGTTSFQYQVQDGTGLKSAVQTYSINVAPVDEPSTGGASIVGTGGKDTLRGTAGNDTINGGTGADSMYGGLGDDTYFVDSSSDKVFELTAEGNDLIVTTSSVTLSSSAYVETVIAQGTSNVSLAGNQLNNVLNGNGGGNSLSGGTGADILNGGLGKDVLTGGSGNDHFVFNTTLGTSNIDTIKDFNVNDDLFDLDNSIFTALTAGDLDPLSFQIGAKALDAQDRIVYDKATGSLFYDADGSGAGAAVQFALLGKNLALNADDFDVI